MSRKRDGWSSVFGQEATSGKSADYEELRTQRIALMEKLESLPSRLKSGTVDQLLVSVFMLELNLLDQKILEKDTLYPKQRFRDILSDWSGCE